MSRIFPTQMPVDAVDAAGLSAITSADGPTFDPLTLAAAAPIHFHPLTPQRWLMVFSTWWSQATPDESVLGTYTDRTSTTDAGWVILSAPTGARSLLNGTVAIPRRTSADSLILTGAASRAQDYLFLLYSLDDRSGAAVAHWRVNSTTGAVVPVAEEILPTITLTNDSPVVFDRGLWYRTPHLVVIGSNLDTDEIYLARKPWGRIGNNRDPNLFGAPNRPDDPRWTYYTGRGWSLNTSEAMPVKDSRGSSMVTIGPVSAASFHDRHYWATVEALEVTGRLAVIYSQRNTPWKRLGTIDLGSTDGGTYLDDTARLQQMLAPNSSQMITGAQSAIPYVVSMQTADYRLDNNWAVWPVSR